MADVIVRVVYDGTVYDLDIDSNIPLRIDISAVENQDIGKFFGVGSQQFDLPGTKSNNQFFKHGYNVGANAVPGFYNSIPGYIIYNGETVLDGQFQLLEIITDDQGYVTYKCRITDQVVTFNDTLASKLIKNGNWDYLDHTLSYANITGSWEGDLLNDSVYYPFAFYGFQNSEQIQLPWPAFLPSGSSSGNYLDNSLTPLNAQQFLPAVKVRDTLDVIFEQAGFNYTGSFVTGSDFEKLYILPKAQEGLGIVGEPGQVATCQVSMTNNQTLTIPSIGNTNIDIVEIDNAYVDPTNAFNETDFYYQINGIGEYSFDGQISFFNPCAFNTGVVEVTLDLMQGSRSGGIGSGTTWSQQTRTLSSADGFNTFTLSVGATIDTSTLNEVFLQVSFKRVSGTPSNLTLLAYGTNFNCTQAPNAVVGGNVNMGLQFGDNTKSIDILNGLIEHFNLVLSPVKGNEKTISIDSFDTWIRNGRIKDWTDKYNTATRIGINHTVDEQPKELIISAEEDVDRFSKLAKENDPFRQYGSLRLIADNNVSLGSKKIGSYFAPVILGGPIESDSTGTGTSGDGSLRIDTSTNFVLPHLYKLENSQVQSYSFKPRIGYKSLGTIPTTDNGTGIYIGPSGGGADKISGSYATIANVSELPATTTSKNLYYNSSYTPFSNTNNLNGGVNAYDEYWATYIESLYWEDSVKVTMDLEFNQNEYYNINLNDRVFIKDTFYRINKINGFNLSQDDIATVELIKLYPAYFEGLDFTGCVFEVSGSYSDANCSGVTPTPTPTPTLTPPGFTWTPTPTPTATPTATPTSTPTPTATPPGFTWTPTPTPTATPLFPTPTPTPATVYELSASLGSTSQALCTAELVQSAYTTTPISSWPSATLYTDSGLTTAFAGGNNFFRFESGSDNVVWSVNNFGSIVVEGQNCSGSLYSFYGTTQQNLNVDPCDKPLTQTYYTLDFSSVNQLTSGDRIYTDATLTTQLADNHLYAFSDTSASNAYATTGSECKYLLIDGASSVGTCIPATPTPTPTVLPNLQSASIDAGSSIGGEGCFNDPTGSVYMAGCLEDLLVGGGYVYEDIYGQEPFDGTSKRFMIHQSASAACSESRAIVTITSAGFASLYQTCGTTVTAFSASYELNSSADVCDNAQTLMVYSDTHTSAAQIQPGDKLYLYPDLSTELLDGYQYAVADVSGSDGYDAGAYSFTYSVLFGAGTVTQCIPATPTPTPTIPPTMTSASIDAGSTIGGEGCFNDPTGSVFLRDSLEDILVSGGNAYTDEQTQIPFVGGTKKYMIHQSASVDYSGTPFSESRAIVTITDAGAISLVNTCSLQVYQFYGTSQVNLNDDPCLDPYTRFVYTDAFSDVADMQNGDKIYTNAALSTELGDNHLYSISNVSASSGRDTLQSRGFKYTLLGGVSQIVSCQPTSSLYYGTTPTTSNPCLNTTPNSYYLTSSVAINEIVPGTRLYSDAGATTEITANDQWIGLGYNVSPATGEIRVYYRTGAGGGIISVQDCGDPFVTPVPTVTPTPTPTATPTATPTPTATLGPQTAWRGTSPTSGDPCLNTTPISYYTTGSIRIDQWSIGMRLYSDAGTTTEITADNQYIGITDLTNNSTSKIKVLYTQASGITNIDDPCSPTPTPTGTPTPTPTPTGTPTPTPTATPPGFEQQISNSSTTSSGGCSFNFTGTKYTTVAFADLTINSVVYDDANLTTVFNGNNRWYRFGQSTASGDSYLVYINTNGQLQQIFFC